MSVVVGKQPIAEEKKTLNLAHRGASAYAPENTIAAFQLALEIGADGIELDVTLTKDGVPVVIHDDSVDRTTDGHGAVSQMTLHQVKNLDAGARFPSYRGQCIPTLEEALQTVGNRGLMNVELKTRSITSDGLEEAVEWSIRKCRMEERVIVSSFNPFALARLKTINPSLARGLLYAPNLPVYLRRAWLRPLAQPMALHPRHDMVTISYMRWVRSKHLKTNTWTTDDPAEMERLLDTGVEAIITNKPDILKRQIEKRQ